MSSEYGDPETRRRILENAWRQLGERGGALKLSDVAEQAEVSRQTVYLHFGDRTGLVLALVQHMDDMLSLGESLQHVHHAQDGSELLERTMRLNAEFWTAVYPVARVLQTADDEALVAAWRDRMNFRQMTFRAIVEHVDAFGELDGSWTIGEASSLLYGIAHFDTWRELTQQVGWSDDQYVGVMTRTLCRTLLVTP